MLNSLKHLSVAEMEKRDARQARTGTALKRSAGFSARIVCNSWSAHGRNTGYVIVGSATDMEKEKRGGRKQIGGMGKLQEVISSE